jgi:hypothetical protein
MTHNVVVLKMRSLTQSFGHGAKGEEDDDTDGTEAR